MFHRFNRIGIVACVLAVLGLSVKVQSKTVPHKERCTAVLTEFSETTIEYTGQGVATHLDKYTIVGGH
jgi:hypothetical protein